MTPATAERERAERLSAGDVIAGLRDRHSASSGWVTVEEARVGTSWWSRKDMPAELRGATDQRIDLFAVSTWRSVSTERLAYEVKVSRSDFVRELATPEKRAAAVFLSHRFLFATPPGLVRPGELPDGCGLVEVDADGRAVQVVRGRRRDPGAMPEPFVHSLLRNAAEQRMVQPCSVAGCRKGGRYFGPAGLPFRTVLCTVHSTALRAGAA